MDDCVVLRPSQAMYQNTSQKKVYAAAKNIFGANVRRFRKERSLSQEDLALKIDADQAYISRIEAGQLNPTLESLAEIAYALDVSLHKLMKPIK